MVFSSSQQIVVAFTVVLFAFVVLPRMFGVGTSGSKDKSFDPRYNRKAGPGPGPGAVRGQPVSMTTPPGSKAQTLENMQQMKMMMEQEMKSDKYKPNSNKGYVFTLMPLYAIGVGLFAAYKFLKIKSADYTSAQKNKVAKGAKKPEETESQLTELEQRLAQTEKMLNSILTQLDPLTNCVKSVAQEQKNEIMSQLQTIRQLMKKRGMDCPPLNIEEPSCERNLDDLIESLAAHETVPEEHTSETKPQGGTEEERAWEPPLHRQPSTQETKETHTGGEEECQLETVEREEEEEVVAEGNEENIGDRELMGTLECSSDTYMEDLGPVQNIAEEPSGLRRRNRLNEQMSDPSIF